MTPNYRNSNSQDVEAQLSQMETVAPRTNWIGGLQGRKRSSRRPLLTQLIRYLPAIALMLFCTATIVAATFLMPKSSGSHRRLPCTIGRARARRPSINTGRPADHIMELKILKPIESSPRADPDQTMSPLSALTYEQEKLEKAAEHTRALADKGKEKIRMKVTERLVEETRAAAETSAKLRAHLKKHKEEVSRLKKMSMCRKDNSGLKIFGAGEEGVNGWYTKMEPTDEPPSSYAPKWMLREKYSRDKIHNDWIKSRQRENNMVWYLQDGGKHWITYSKGNRKAFWSLSDADSMLYHKYVIKTSDKSKNSPPDGIWETQTRTMHGKGASSFSMENDLSC